MADLRSRFIEDYAGGLLNVSRQELATNGEILSQDGFLTDSTIFVEDGVGTKSGLKLGIGLAESVDPTTTNGIVNVRYADRTYTKIRDTKIFATAIASSQAALAESVAESFNTIESAIDLIDSQLTTHDSLLARLLQGQEDLGGKQEQSDAVRDNYITVLLREIQNILDNVGLPGIYVPPGDSGGTDVIINLPDILIPNPVSPGEVFNNNVKLGRGALGSLNTGILNTAIGIESLPSLSIGSGNTALGTLSGSGLVNGDNNTYIGNGARSTKSSASNEIVIGSSSTKYIQLAGDPYTYSDIIVQGEDTETDIDKSNEAYLEKLLKFVKNLIYKEITWKASGQRAISIDPQSLRDSEKKYEQSGFVNSETKTVSKTKFIPVALLLIEYIHNVFRSELDTLNEFMVDSTALHDQMSSRIDGLANTIESYGSIPIRGIIMWSGQEVPYKWALCNGQEVIINGETITTPDLRDKFIIGAGLNFGVGALKDEDPVVPNHTHNVTPDFPAMTETMIAPNSVTNWSIPNAVNISQQSVIGYQDSAFADGPNESEVLTRQLPTVQTAQEGGTAHETYPPYYALAFIMRIA